MILKINQYIEIVFFLEKENILLRKYLNNLGITKIFINNENTIEQIIYKICNSNESDLSLEIEKLKKIIKENNVNIKKAILEKILIQEFNINFQNKQSIIINAIDDEPYVVTENFYLFLFYEDILEIVDKIANVFNIKNIIICIKASNSENLNKLMKALRNVESVYDVYRKRG